MANTATFPVCSYEDGAVSVSVEYNVNNLNITHANYSNPTSGTLVISCVDTTTGQAVGGSPWTVPPNAGTGQVSTAGLGAAGVNMVAETAIDPKTGQQVTATVLDPRYNIESTYTP